jgi:ribosomal protein S18 acetylase RimI-like enzyme
MTTQPTFLAPARARDPQPTPLAPHHERDAAAVLARAFRDNPLNVAVLGDDPTRRLRANLAAMTELVPIARRVGLVLAATPQQRCAGVLLAAPPLGYPFPPPGLGAWLRGWITQGPRVRRRWSEVFHHLDALHPQEPHWYIAALGVDPPQQRNGLGRALLLALCALADADGVFSYLETDRLENVAFYASAGFVATQESQCLGVRIWHMQRPVREAPRRARRLT